MISTPITKPYRRPMSNLGPSLRWIRCPLNVRCKRTFAPRRTKQKQRVLKQEMWTKRPGRLAKRIPLIAQWWWPLECTKRIRLTWDFVNILLCLQHKSVFAPYRLFVCWKSGLGMGRTLIFTKLNVSSNLNLLQTVFGFSNYVERLKTSYLAE